MQKNAVAVWVLHQAFLHPDRANKLMFEVIDGHLRFVREGFDLRLVHPNESRRAGTAIPAARAFKRESLSIPRPFAHLSHSQCYQRLCFSEFLTIRLSDRGLPRQPRQSVRAM